MPLAQRAGHRAAERGAGGKDRVGHPLGRRQNAARTICQLHIQRAGLVRRLDQNRAHRIGITVTLRQGRNKRGMRRHDHRKLLVKLQLPGQPVGRQQQIRLAPLRRLIQRLPVTRAPDNRRKGGHGHQEQGKNRKAAGGVLSHGPNLAAPALS